MINIGSNRCSNENLSLGKYNVTLIDQSYKQDPSYVALTSEKPNARVSIEAVEKERDDDVIYQETLLQKVQIIILLFLGLLEMSIDYTTNY